MLARDASGEEPLYGPREWNRVQRAKARRVKKSGSKEAKLAMSQ